MITPGTILINRDVPRPPCFELEDTSPSEVWGALKRTLTPRERDQELSRTGWTFFCMSTVNTTAFGFNRTRMLQTALRRFIDSVKAAKCNCLEIDDVETRSFLGVPYVSLSGHARHIQMGMRFAGQ